MVTARALFLRVFWWLVFVALGSVGVAYMLTSPPQTWAHGPVGKLGLLMGGVLVGRILAIRWPAQTVSLLLLGFIMGAPWFLGNRFDAFSLMAVANLPLVLLCLLWGWRGAVMGVGVALLGFATRATALEDFVIASLLLAGSSLIGGFLHHLTTALDQTNQQLETNNALLTRSANTDAMTGLGNRRALIEEFEGFSKPTPLVLTLWDLNDLKRINDQFGHAAGDAFLLEFVQVLQAQSRSGDRYYRVGGDEFVGLHPNLQDGRVVRNRVLERFGDVAVGWVLVKDHHLESALLEADVAMYEHKAKTKTGVFEEAKTV